MFYSLGNQGSERLCNLPRPHRCQVAKLGGSLWLLPACEALGPLSVRHSVFQSQHPCVLSRFRIDWLDVLLYFYFAASVQFFGWFTALRLTHYPENSAFGLSLAQLLACGDWMVLSLRNKDSLGFEFLFLLCCQLNKWKFEKINPPTCQ